MPPFRLNFKITDIYQGHNFIPLNEIVQNGGKGDRPFVCSCGKAYKHRKSLWTHKNFQCDANTKLQFQCPYCPKKCNVKGNLRVHVAKHHSNICSVD